MANSDPNKLRTPRDQLYLNHFNAEAERDWKCDKDEEKEDERDEERDELSAKQNVLFLVRIVPNISDRVFLRHCPLETSIYSESCLM